MSASSVLGLVRAAEAADVGEAAQLLAAVPETETDDLLLRMQRDLLRALAKPVEDRRWVMAIDQGKCAGCHACTVGCIAENHLPPGVVCRSVDIEETGVYPDLGMRFTPRPCMHCDNPPCLEVCPADATWKRPDGIVVIDYDLCIGCLLCVDECPYGARHGDSGGTYTSHVAAGGEALVLGPDQPYESRAPMEYLKAWPERGKGEPPAERARKCHYCFHRLENGQLPMCVTTCIGRATLFGDANDPDSYLAQTLAREAVEHLLPEQGTQPRTCYIPQRNP